MELQHWRVYTLRRFSGSYAGERTKDTIQFTKDYCDFIREFSAYLLNQFPDLDVLSVEKKLINDMLEQSNIFLGKDDPYEDYQMPQFVNPLL